MEETIGWKIAKGMQAFSHFAVAEAINAALRSTAAERDNEIMFNEGWQEHISDLLDAMKPFVQVFGGTIGRIPVERLSFNDWHTLSKTFDAAVAALQTTEREPAFKAKVLAERDALAAKLAEAEPKSRRL